MSDGWGDETQDNQWYQKEDNLSGKMLDTDNDIKVYDNKYDRCLIDEQFIWYSEAYGEIEEAHKLIITKLDNLFSIKFYLNPNNQLFNISGNCPICFCLSGSRNQKIANLFSEMFLEYQYSDYKKYIKSR